MRVNQNVGVPNFQYITVLMKFIHFILGQTNIKTILVTIICLLGFIFLLPNQYSKKNDLAEYLVFFLLFLFFMLVGFLICSLKLDQNSPAFEQASAGVVGLLLMIPLVIFMRPDLLEMLSLAFVFEFGLVSGQFIYQKKKV